MSALLHVVHTVHGYLADPTPASTGNGDVPNPMNGVKPDVSVLGTAFNAKWKVLVGAIWGLGIGVGAVIVIYKLVHFMSAKSQGHTVMMSEAKTSLVHAVIGLVGLGGVSTIIGAILILAG